jgi:sugar phosphate permease
MMNFGGYIGGALAPTVTGFIVQATHGAYGSAFVLAGAIAVIGALCALVFIREPRSQKEPAERKLVW